jgi:hypothetical protein
MVAKEYFDCFAATNFLVLVLVIISGGIGIVAQWKPNVRNVRNLFLTAISEGRKIVWLRRHNSVRGCFKHHKL